MTEEEVINCIVTWLQNDGWGIHINIGHAQGPDIVALRNNEKWIIEAKGEGVHAQANRNNFLALLGTIVLGISDERVKYSIALPNIPKFRNLLNGVSELVRQRTGLTILLVSPECGIEEL